MRKCTHTIGAVKRSQGRRGKWSVRKVPTGPVWQRREGHGIVVVNLGWMWLEKTHSKRVLGSFFCRWARYEEAPGKSFAVSGLA